MVVNYAFTRAFRFILTQRAFYLPFFIIMLVINVALIPVERSIAQMGMMGTFMTLLLAMTSIVAQVAMIYSINEKEEKGDYVGFLDSLWPGLCFTPGFILQSIKLCLFVGLGCLLLVLPGIYLGFKHFFDPYYSIIKDDGALFNKEHKFETDDFISVLIYGLAFIPIMLIFNAFPMAIDMIIDHKFVQYLAAPFSTMTSLFSATSLYFYIDYTVRISRKS